MIGEPARVLALESAQIRLFYEELGKTADAARLKFSSGSTHPLGVVFPASNQTLLIPKSFIFNGLRFFSLSLTSLLRAGLLLGLSGKIEKILPFGTVLSRNQ